jgi:hypothetical protein
MNVRILNETAVFSLIIGSSRLLQKVDNAGKFEQ